MGRTIDLSDVGRRFVGWWRLSILERVWWTIRKAIGFGVAYAVAMAVGRVRSMNGVQRVSINYC